ncbi:MAG: hypothetical protein IKU20_08450 [Lachnospiraceae bacterium]|nr:hypothetical protein [Lachnospiraceae bacterium]
MNVIERVAQLYGVDPSEVRDEIRKVAEDYPGLRVEPEAFVHFLAQVVLLQKQNDDQDVSADD